MPQSGRRPQHQNPINGDAPGHAARMMRRSSSRPVKTKAPRKPERSQNSSEPQAATLVGLTSRRLLELAIGIARGFIASGISRTRSTCRSPFSRLAPLT
jgi:hypothetical protein